MDKIFFYCRMQSDGNERTFLRGQQLTTINQQFFKCGAKVQQKKRSHQISGLRSLTIVTFTALRILGTLKIPHLAAIHPAIFGRSILSGVSFSEHR